MISMLGGFPPGTVYTITGISRSLPGIVTLSSVALPYSFAIENGMTVNLQNIAGMTALNRGFYIISQLNPTDMTVALYDLNFNPVDTTNLPAYTGGGQMNITSYPANAGQPPGLMYNSQ
jgi:hypothetical protein